MQYNANAFICSVYKKTLLQRGKRAPFCLDIADVKNAIVMTAVFSRRFSDIIVLKIRN